MNNPEKSEQVERLRPRRRRGNNRTEKSEEYFLQIGERLFHLKRRIRMINLQEEELPPPPGQMKSSQKMVAAVTFGAFAVFLTVSLAFINNMGPNPESSANALAVVIAALASALGAGIIGVAFKVLRSKK